MAKSEFIKLAIEQGLAPKSNVHSITPEQHAQAKEIFYPSNETSNMTTQPYVGVLAPKDNSVLKVDGKNTALFTKFFGANSRKLLYSRAIRAANQLTVVRVFSDGIEEEKIDIIFDENKLQEIKPRTKKTLWQLPIYPIGFVDIFNVNVPAKNRKADRRKVHWMGKGSTDADWKEGVFGNDFNKDEIGSNSDWFPIGHIDFKKMSSALMAMTIESPEKRFLTPEQINEGIVTFEDLQKEEHRLAVTSKFLKTGWACPNSWEEKEKQNWCHINPDHELYSGRSDHGYMVTNGDSLVQIEAITKQITKYPLLGVYFSIAAGGFARGLYNSKGHQFKGEISTLVNLNGEGGKSKSSTMAQVQSIFTTPRNSKQFISKATAAALELIAELANHGVFFIDELQVACDNNNGAEIMTTLMGLLNGVGKQATRNVGTEQRDPRVYDNLVLTSANDTIENMVTRRFQKGYDAFSEALKNRVIELHIDLWSAYPSYDPSSAEYREVQNDIDNFDAILRANHGFLYQDLIAHYIENRDELYDKMTKIAGNLSEFYGLEKMSKDAARKKHFFAYTEAGMEAFFEVLALSEDVRKTVRAKWLEMVAYIVDSGLKHSAKKEDDIFGKVTGWIQANYGKFAVYGKGGKAGYAWVPGKEHCDEKTQNTYAQNKISACNDANNKCYGGFFQSTPLTSEGAWTGFIGLNHVAVEAIQKDLSIDFDVFIQKAKASNLLDFNEDRKTKKVRLGGSLENFYCFKIGEYLSQFAVENEVGDFSSAATPPDEVACITEEVVSAPVEISKIDEDWGKLFEEPVE